MTQPIAVEEAFGQGSFGQSGFASASTSTYQNFGQPGFGNGYFPSSSPSPSPSGGDDGITPYILGATGPRRSRKQMMDDDEVIALALRALDAVEGAIEIEPVVG